MNRIAVVLTVLVPLAFGGPAAADDGGDVVQVMPMSAFDPLTQSATISPIIFINRCVGGCKITSSSVSNAATNESTIPTQTPGTVIDVPAFPYDDASWGVVLNCVKEIYSPFNVQITDVDPGPTVVHHEIIVAGTASVFGLGQGILGISPVSADHTPVNNNISFAFAGSYSNSTNPNASFGLIDLCATIGQETAHSWGLDHEYACVDPMTYLGPCGGQRFFRNKDYQCGTGAPGECNCDGKCGTSGPTQNSHQRILGVFGAGQSIVPGPTVSLASPANGTTVTNGFAAFVNSSGKRGTFKVQLILNGYLWAEKLVSDDPMGGNLAPIYATTFQVNAPAAVPDGVIDIDARACDDLDQCADAKITVTKGAPCTDTSKCAAGQKCDAGKCYWDPPSLNIGDACTYQQACISGMCIAAGSSMFCSQTCFVGQADQCPANFECQLDATRQGYCLPAPPPQGCCSAGDLGPGGVAAQAGLAGLVLTIALRRRRRRA
jgi:hypothetical protein